MNTEFEVAEETTAEPATEDTPVLEPEILTISEEEIKEFTTPERFAQQLQVIQQHAGQLTPHDTLSVKRTVALIEICTVASRHADMRLHEIIDEPSKVVKDAKLVWEPFTKGFDAIKKQKSAEVSQFVTEQRRLQEEQQRKEIAEAKAKQDALDKKAEDERLEAQRIRDEADRLAREEEARVAQVERDRLAAEQRLKDEAAAIVAAKAAGDRKAAKLAQEALERTQAAEAQKVRDDEAARLAAEEDQERLNKLAVKADGKAEKAELAASNVTTTVIQQQSKTIDLGTSKLSTKAPKKVWILPGWDKAKPLRVTDAKLAKLVGDLDKLPEGVRFLLKYSDLNPVHLNKAFGEVPFPEPFGTADDFGGAALRTGK